jgi:hypothetical protein
MKSTILFLTFLYLSGLTVTVSTAGPVARLRTAPSTPVLSASQNTFDLRTFGAVGDGVTDDGPALQQALDAVAIAGGGTVHVPAGRYAIITPVAKNFSNIPAASLTIQGVESSTPIIVDGAGQDQTAGLDLTSELVIKTGETAKALSLSGLESLLVKDLAFIGTLERVSDASVTLSLTDIADATIRHCEFYGLASFVWGGAIVLATRSRLRVTETPFLGCTVGSGYNGAVVQNISWKNISITDIVFADYGQRPEFYGKTTWGATYSWIGIGNAAGVDNLSPRREAFIEHVFLDEGHIFGIASRPDLYPATGSSPIDLIYISRLRMNVNNLGFSGLYLYRANRVFVGDSFFGWSHNASAALAILDVGEAVLDKLECVLSANTIYADARTGKLTVINSIYEHLASAAQTTLVINTAPGNDPVQFVAQQFRDELGREPDAAAHIYWTRELLLCAGNWQCVNQRKLALASYLGSAPSPIFSITGQITNASGAGLSGVTLNLGGSQNVSAQTDADGRFRFQGLPTSGVYTVTPIRVNYTFNSPTWTTTTPSGDRVANFTAILNNYSIAGRVLDSTGQSLTGVTVALSGSQSATTTTDASGNYSFTIPAEGNYTVSAAKVHYVFAPLTTSFSNLGGNQIANFSGTLNRHTISGQVTSAGNALAGVAVSLSGSQSDVAMTGPDGRFTFSMPAGGIYTVVPSRTNYLFTPASSIFTDLDSSRIVDFAATLIRTLEFSAASYQIVEGETSLVVTVIRNGDTSGPATATYSTSDDSSLDNCSTPDTDLASSGCDYITSVGTVRFAPGETSKTFSIPIIDDGYAEGSESFEVILSNLAGVNMGSHGTASITIADNETVNGTNPIEAAASFVRQHYIDFFNREPDAPGLAFWTNQITSCGSDAACIEVKRTSASAAFYLSIEFQETGYLVYRTHKAAYGNLTGAPVPVMFDEFQPDTRQIGQGVVVGETDWAEVLQNNKQTFAAEFVARPRFLTAHPTTLTPTQFVEGLFAKAGVTPSAAERTAAINEFGTASTSADMAARGRVLRLVAENQTFAQQEFNRAFVLIQYFGYLRRNPNDAPEATLDFQGYNFWLAKLNQFNGNFINAEMVKAFIVSGEYRQRFGP